MQSPPRHLLHRASSRQTDPAERLAAAEATGHAAGACTLAKHLSRALLASQFTGPAQLLLGIAGGHRRVPEGGCLECSGWLGCPDGGVGLPRAG